MPASRDWSTRTFVSVHAAGEIDGRLYTAMRHADGENLRALLRRSGPLVVRRVAQMGLQLGTALDAAHLRGVVHGSLKPSKRGHRRRRGGLAAVRLGLCAGARALHRQQPAGHRRADGR